MIYQDIISRIRRQMGFGNFWFMCDGTTDLNGNPVFANIVGSTQIPGHRAFIGITEQNSKTAADVHKCFEEGMRVLYPMPNFPNGTFISYKMFHNVCFVTRTNNNLSKNFYHLSVYPIPIPISIDFLVQAIFSFEIE